MAIKVELISNRFPKEKRQYSCDNCNSLAPFILRYTFIDSKGKEFNKLTLCKDCSCALANLHYKCMEEGKPHKYEDGFLKEDI